MAGQFISQAAGLVGLVLGAQAPGFTLQYMQNLNGRVAELETIVAQYDGVAASLGETRDGYVADLRTDGAEAARRTADVVESAIARYEKLVAHLENLNRADPFRRPLIAARGLEPDVAQSTMENFKWTAPLTPDAAVYALGGGAVLWGLPTFIFGLIGGLFGGRRPRYA